MVSKEELRELMDSYGMLTSVFDFEHDLSKQLQIQFARDVINLTTDLEASDLNTQAFDKVNSETDDRENLLSTQYYFDFRDALIDIVMNLIERDMNDIISESESIWKHM